MKKLLLILLMCAPIAAMAQKFGHVNAQDIIQVMPDYTKAKTEIDALQKQYEADLKSMQDTLGILSVHLFIVLWIQNLELLCQIIQSFLLITLQKGQTDVVRNSGNLVYTIAQGIYVHH